MEILPDTSAVVDGRVTERVEDGFDGTVHVAEAVVGELEAQANDGRESGWDGAVEAVLDALRHAAVDDRARVRQNLHTGSRGVEAYKYGDGTVTIPGRRTSYRAPVGVP